MKRRTLRKFISGQAKHTPQPRSSRRKEALTHHNVYVVLLDQAIKKLRKVQLANPDCDPTKPCVYVGMSGLTPEERFLNHKRGIKCSSLVKRYGIRLLPQLYAHLNPLPYEAAAQMEKDLTEDLRRAGYTVVGGH